MNRRRIGFLLILLGTVLVALVAAVVYVQLSQVERLQAAQPRVWVAVAKTDIPERSVIAESQIELVRLPDSAVPAGAARYQAVGDAPADPAEHRRLIDQVKDKYTPQRIYRGEVINRDRLGQTAARNTPSYDIAKGKVLYVFPVRLRGGNPPNDPVAIAFLNAVRPGDFVDIYYTSYEPPPGQAAAQDDRDRARYLYTRRLLQNLKVVNVGFFPDPSGKEETASRDDRYLTFEVTPDEALLLKWLKDIAVLDGNLELVLRSPLDTEPFPPATVGYDTAAQRFGLGARQ